VTTMLTPEKSPAAADPMAGRPTRLVLIFGAIGAIFLGVQVWALTHWITSGRATPTSAGSTPEPTWMTVVHRTWEVAGVFAVAAFVWHFLIKPARREGRLTSDGILVLVFATMWFNDPLANYSTPFLTYNANLVNFGSWLSDIPGWVLPNAHKTAFPILWIAPVYVYLVLGMAMVGTGVMRRAKARWPQLSNGSLIGICWGFFVAFDLILEPLAMRLGFFTYAGSVRALTINAGHYYQYPIYNGLLWGGFWAAVASLRYFRDDRGHSVAERGVDELSLRPRTRTGLRFLALVGFCNTVCWAAYIIPMQAFALNADPWPKDISNRSYLTNELCGEGTDYACPGPAVPIPRPKSSHVAPDGSLVDGSESIDAPTAGSEKTP
jgi:hypothetical protein